MPRRGLDIEEALTLFELLPSDEESEISGDESDEDFPEDIADFESDEEESVENIQNVESDDEESEENMQNMPGPLVVTEVAWLKKSIGRKNLPQFTERSGPSNEIQQMEDKSPLSLFLALFSLSLIEHIVFQTNLYAVQEQKPFTQLTVEELLRFLAINLLMGIKRMPSYRDYWMTSAEMNDSYISNLMPVKRFSWILSHLHVNDNSKQPKKEDPDFDKLYKLRPYIDHFSKRFLEVFLPNEKQAVDESMIKFKGRSTLKQYLPKKPIKRGYKVWMRCDSTGFACQFDIYTGRTGELAEKNLAERVVKNLCVPIFGKNHRLFMDNYFSTYNLFRFLETQDIYCCGTVNLSRKNMPKNLDADKTLKRGDFDWATSNDGITCIKWKDRKSVIIMSNMEDPAQPTQVKRKEKNGSNIFVPCPKAIVDYNSNMGFVDHFDHLKSLYEISRKSKKWWHRIFFHFLDVAVANAYILHKVMAEENSDKPKTLKEFRREIVTGLVEMSREEIPPKKRKGSSPVAIKSHKPFVPEEKRLKHAEHLAVRCTSRRCALCSTSKKQKRTNWMCSTCKVPLCMQAKENTCFKKYHTK